MTPTFAHPHVLWFLAAIPILAIYQRREGVRARARFRFPSLSLLRSTPKSDGSAVLSHLRLASLVLLIVALARPQHGQTHEEALTPTTDILLVLDTSGSMAALDFKPRK